MEWSTRAFRLVLYFTTAVEDPFVIEDILRNGAEPDEEPVDEEEEDETMESMLLAGHEDDPDDEGISDDDSDLGLGSTGEQFGTNIRTLWAKRKVNMVSDFCIAGWLLSPLDEVMEDVKSARNVFSNQAMDRILNKLYHNLTENELGGGKGQILDRVE
jgi:hypothetical protein